MITIDDKKITDIVLDEKNVVKIQDANTLKVLWEKVEPVVVDYFYIENAYEDINTLTLATRKNGNPSGSYTSTVEYSKDKKNWTTLTLEGTNKITMNLGEKVYFRNDNGFFNCADNYTFFYCSNNFNVGGKITTLLNYNDDNVPYSPYCFYNLFYGYDNNTYLKNSNNLVLPTSISECCYYNMFRGCTGLISAPELPATTLTWKCYSGMFRSCKSLTTPPELPATTLGQYCYKEMFYSSGLTTAPELPATSLVNACYHSMFSYCKSLTSSPILPAKTLATNCYLQMFQGCSSLNKVTTYADNITPQTWNNYIDRWLSGVSSTGTFYNYGSGTYPTGESGIPSGWTVITE